MVFTLFFFVAYMCKLCYICKRSSPETIPEETLAEARKALANKRKLLNVNLCLLDVPGKVEFLPCISLHLT